LTEQSGTNLAGSSLLRPASRSQRWEAGRRGGVAEGVSMLRFRVVLTLSIGLAMALGVTLAWVEYPDLPPLWLSLASALLAFLLTDLWHRLGAREREALYPQLLRHLPTRLRIRDTRGRMRLDTRHGDVDGMLLQEN